MFTLNQVVPWGRSYDEYRAMFALLDDNLNKPILGCGDGPASFNAEATRRGYDVISVDPIYAFDAEAIRSRINDTYPTVIEQLAAYRDQYVWNRFATPDALGQARLAAMNRFLADYPDGKARGRYRTGQLPDLPFDNHTFHLALCSHLLFLYSDHLDEAFHVASVLSCVGLHRKCGSSRLRHWRSNLPPTLPQLKPGRVNRATGLSG